MSRAVEMQIYPFTEKTETLPVCLRGIGGTQYQGYVQREGGYCWDQILYCISGTGCMILDGQSHDISAGDVIFLPKAFPHEYYPYEIRWEVRWIVFDGAGIEGLLEQLGLDRPLVLKLSDLKELNKLFDKMFSSLRADRVSGIYKCSGLCYDMLLELHNMLSYERKQGGAGSDLITPVLNYIEEHYCRDLPVSELVELSGVSHQYLGRVFRQTIGTSIEKYIRSRRLWEARHLLIETELSVTEIASRCGFSEAGYFSTVFRREEGIPPVEYRRKSRLKIK
ncbi:AraC family transcriptional regulator [Ruminococcus sp.]|uniref:AraC family transcriptional regulator n=1 Tax=Ruminococcus sp. TaxID=41978 RepID=UPI0025CCEBC3|nr:AraC family transcriptional regulator [Ruminococcus sp.]MBQ8966117.1 helix-turn-helix transcriptional regulator [Ruminococcus sp.]